MKSKILETPYIEFPAGWAIQFVPAYLGIHAHFRVRLPSGTVKNAILLHNKEGYAYWEVSPETGSYETRCDVDDVDTLIQLVGAE